MKRILMATVLAVTAALSLTACDTSAEPVPVVNANEPLSLELLQRAASGFTVGQQLSTRTVYVFFDMQCPHCGELWESSKPLQTNTKFVWVPVGVLNRASIAQGSTILASKDPVTAMNEHETSLAAHRGGMAADSDAMDKLGGKIKANTQLMTRFKADSVPFIVAKDPVSGELMTTAGAMSTSELRNFLKM